MRPVVQALSLQQIVLCEMLFVTFPSESRLRLFSLVADAASLGGPSEHGAATPDVSGARDHMHANAHRKSGRVVGVFLQ